NDRKIFLVPAFRFSFSSFVTLQIIPALYGRWVLIGAIGALSTLTSGVGVMHFGYNWWGGAFFLGLIWAVVFFSLWVIGGRVCNYRAFPRRKHVGIGRGHLGTATRQ
ncbi:MAG: DUF4282 domain-containing protein, partial [Desulfotomaculales bacterium]